MSTISITFGERVENHHGMQMIGELASSGYSIKELLEIKERFGGELTMVSDLLPEEDRKGNEAAILIIKNFFNADDLYKEQIDLEYDMKAKMRGRVVNKRARYNLCFCDFSQEHDYEEGKGTIIDFEEVPVLRAVREKISNSFGEKALNLNAESNLYYDINNCGIGFHGDSERKIVICLRLGETMSLAYQWYLNSKREFQKLVFEIEHGDLYIMSEKAVGTDWKKRNIYTLRHAAGCDKYIK